MPATIGGPTRSGVMVPASAVLRVDGAAWVYVQSAPNRFDRRRLGDTSAVPGGLFAAGGVHAGDRIVISGAAALYAAERGGGHAPD